MKWFSMALLFCGAVGKRIEIADVTQGPDKLSVPGTFGAKTFTPSSKRWSLAPYKDFIKEGSRLGLAGGDFVANGNPIKLEIIRSKRFSMLTVKHAHFVIQQDSKAVAWMRSKYNAVSGYDWDLMPGNVKLPTTFAKNKSPAAKKLRLAKGKGVVYPFNPTYFAKAYITAPDDKKQVYYTVTHLNPISKGMRKLGESHVRITRGWCRSAASGKKCKTDAEAVCTFYHKSCVLKTKAGDEIGTITRTKKGWSSGGNWEISVKKGDALLFAQVAGFIDMTDDLKRTMTLGPLKIPVNAVERLR